MRRIFEALLIISVGIVICLKWPQPESPPRDLPAAVETLPSKKTEIVLPSKASAPAKEQKLMQDIHLKFATGDFIGAVELADAAADESGYTPSFYAWLNEQMPALLTSAGWTKLKLGNCEQANIYLLRAESMSHSVESIKGLAVCYYKLRNYVAASEWFQKYLELSPNDEQMKVVYSDILESEGRFGDAVTLLGSVIKDREEQGREEVDSAALDQRLKSMQGRARENQHQIRDHSLHFTIRYRAGDHEDLVAYVLNTLEEALSDYSDRFGFQLPQSPIEVVLYPKDTFKDMVVGGPDWAVGLYDGRLRIPVDGNSQYSEIEIVLRHELVHALIALRSDHRNLPAWVDEGLAQRFACQKRGCEAFQFPPKPGDFLEVAAFEGPFTSFTSHKARRAYRQSLYVIFTLEQLYGSEALTKMISQISKSNQLSSDAILKPWNISFNELHQKAESLWQKREVLKPIN